MPYEEYFKAAGDGLIIVNCKGFIVEANPSAERLFGYSQGELLGQPVELLLPDTLHGVHRQHRENYFAIPRNRSMGTGLNLAGRRKDGSQFLIEVGLTYARGTERGDLVIAAVIDITERVALEREARRAETVVSLGTIATGIAHDLNNPLQTIRSRVELLLELPDTTPASEIKEDLAVIHRQAQRAGRIVEEFLGLSRRRDKMLALVSLNRLVERTLLLFGQQLRKAGIHVETNLEEVLPEIMGDSTALERVLINLLGNARDAMPQGGAVMLATSRSSDRPDWLHLTVADTGTGIAPDALSKVFDLLYMTKAEGTGLGLWLSRRIVQEHKGKIEVQSESGRATTFTIMPPTENSSKS
ncbi:MAG TPA: ATP-binding protein [Candidatus Binataceae bacterium]|nr:ATP-binding protein [Candidatus Binataceae bacterium]